MCWTLWQHCVGWRREHTVIFAIVNFRYSLKIGFKWEFCKRKHSCCAAEDKPHPHTMAVFWQSNRSTFMTVREHFEKQTYPIWSNRCRTPFSGCPRNDTALNKERSKVVYSLPQINTAFNRQGHRDDSCKCKDTVWRTGNGHCHSSRQNLPQKWSPHSIVAMASIRVNIWYIQ